MISLLATILPFSAGASLSPTVLVVGLKFGGASGGSRATAAIYAAGNAAPLLVVTTLALALAAGTGGAESSPRDVGVVKLVLAALLAVYGFKALLKPDSERDRSHAHDTERPARVFLVGTAMMATNFSSLALFFPAVHEIGVSRAGDAARVVAYLFLFTATMLPALVPLLPSNALGRAMGSATRWIHERFGAHQRLIVPAITFVFAAWLAVQGVSRLLGSG